MIDGVVDFERYRTVTSFTVREDCIFVEDGHLTADGIVENVAQTCAARMGYINIIDKEHVKLGFIGAVRDMRFLRLP